MIRYIYIIFIFLSCQPTHSKYVNSEGKTIKVVKIQKGDTTYFEEYFETDTIFKSYIRINNKLNGKVIEYFEDGKVRAIDNYKNDVLHGIVKHYHPKTRKVSFDMNLINGKSDGPSSFYDSTGQVTKTNYWHNDILFLSKTFYQSDSTSIRILPEVKLSLDTIDSDPILKLDIYFPEELKEIIDYENVQLNYDVYNKKLDTLPLGNFYSPLSIQNPLLYEYDKTDSILYFMGFIDYLGKSTSEFYDKVVIVESILLE